ncbi:hypothetical protein TRVL_09767 [Trypanosoma vivax]|nr:hypothetical protein TRVL_09767 [Trypanosoma vivax]
MLQLLAPLLFALLTLPSPSIPLFTSTLWQDRVCTCACTAVVRFRALPPGAKAWPDGEERSTTFGMACVLKCLYAQGLSVVWAARNRRMCASDEVSIFSYCPLLRGISRGPSLAWCMSLDEVAQRARSCVPKVSGKGLQS